MRLNLLGAPTWQDGPHAGALPWQRPTALLAIVACHPAGIGRDVLAALLLPDAADAAARQNLRRNLHRARALLPRGELLQADDRRLCWTGECDVTDFLRAADAQDWARAAELQPAPLLAGCGSLGLHSVDDWVHAERARLQRRLRVALLARLADAAAGDGERGAWITRLAELDPLDESALQASLQAAIGPASRAAALAACDDGLRRLQHELGLAAAARTLALREQVAAATAGTPRTRLEAPAASASPRSFAWVDHAAPLVGRDAERDAVLARLLDGPGRLYTLVGLGGVGKTRLALAVADAWGARTQGLVVRVDLVAVDTGADLPAALALEAGLGGEAGGVAIQLEAWLADVGRQRPLLLLLDNFEHLLADPGASEWPRRWAEAAPQCRVLVTSREALGLAMEFRIEVNGLAAGAPGCAASALFEHHARRLGAPPQPQDEPDVRAIARRLQGHPLGLELAASWAPLMSAREIRSELERGLAFLADDEVAQAGQRSLRAVFERSWSMLPPAGRELLSGLTVFEGGFDLDAVRAVAGAPLSELLRLASKSLLQRVAIGRFDLHPMVRQFAARELAATRRASLHESHAEHYASRVAGLEGLAPGRVAPDALVWLNLEARNLTAAWRRAVAARRYDLVAGLRGQLQELMLTPIRASLMLELWRLAEQALPPDDALGLQLALGGARALVALDRPAEAEARLDEIEPRLTQPLDRSVACTLRGRSAQWHGDRQRFERLTLEALRLAEQAAEPLQLVATLKTLVSIEGTRGRADAGREHARRLLALTEAHGLNLHRGTALRLLAQCTHDLGDESHARALLDAATQALEHVGDASDLAQLALTASDFAGQRGDFEAMVGSARRAVQLAERHGLTGSLLRGLFRLGEGCIERGEHREARATLERCLGTAMRVRHATTMARAATVLALLHHRHGNAAAAGWLAGVGEQPELGVLDRDYIGERLDALVPDAPARDALRASRAGHTLQTLCAEILAAPPFET